MVSGEQRQLSPEQWGRLRSDLHGSEWYPTTLDLAMFSDETVQYTKDILNQSGRTLELIEFERLLNVLLNARLDNIEKVQIALVDRFVCSYGLGPAKNPNEKLVLAGFYKLRQLKIQLEKEQEDDESNQQVSG